MFNLEVEANSIGVKFGNVPYSAQTLILGVLDFQQVGPYVQFSPLTHDFSKLEPQTIQTLIYECHQLVSGFPSRYSLEPKKFRIKIYSAICFGSISFTLKRIYIRMYIVPFQLVLYLYCCPWAPHSWSAYLVARRRTFLLRAFDRTWLT